MAIVTVPAVHTEIVEAFTGSVFRSTSLGFDAVVRTADGRIFRKREPTRYCADSLLRYVREAGMIAPARWIAVPQCDGIELDCATADHDRQVADDGRPGIPMGPYGDGTFVGDY